MNIHTIHGRLTRDPELTKGADESRDRVNFTVAVDRRFGDETDFFNCVCFGKRAAVIDKWFSKGREIIITGEGQIRSYEDKNGIKRRDYSIVVSDFDFCGSKAEPAPELKPQDLPDSFEKADSDIPF